MCQCPVGVQYWGRILVPQGADYQCSHFLRCRRDEDRGSNRINNGYRTGPFVSVVDEDDIRVAIQSTDLSPTVGGWRPSLTTGVYSTGAEGIQTAKDIDKVRWCDSPAEMIASWSLLPVGAIQKISKDGRFQRVLHYVLRMEKSL